MARYKIFGMNTGFGDKTYTIMYWDGERWVSSRPVKYWKTKQGAQRYAKRRGITL
jgi:hypothetical protein